MLNKLNLLMLRRTMKRMMSLRKMRCRCMMLRKMRWRRGCRRGGRLWGCAWWCWGEGRGWYWGWWGVGSWCWGWWWGGGWCWGWWWQGGEENNIETNDIMKTIIRMKLPHPSTRHPCEKWTCFRSKDENGKEGRKGNLEINWAWFGNELILMKKITYQT